MALRYTWLFQNGPLAKLIAHPWSSWLVGLLPITRAYCYSLLRSLPTDVYFENSWDWDIFF